MNPISRRKIFHALAAGASVAALKSSSSAAPSPADPAPLTDTNVYLDPWFIRHLPLADPAALSAKLTANGVTEAWAGSLDALFHKDIAGVNARTAETCARHPVFKPVGAINPTLPRWEDDIGRCAARHRMRGVRLHPNHHNYKLDDPRFTELLKLATGQRLFVQIVVGMEDERTQNALLRIAPVDLTPLVKALAAAPDARVMLLNWQRSTGGKPTLGLLKNTPVLFDIALAEGIMAIETLLEELPAGRFCFGSYAPVFYFEAAKLKLRESALDEKQLAAITHGNAANFHF